MIRRLSKSRKTAGPFKEVALEHIAYEACNKTDWKREVMSSTHEVECQGNLIPQSKDNKPNDLTVIPRATKGLKSQVKEKQKQKNTTAGEGGASDPGRLCTVVVVASSDDVVRVLDPPPQHARVTIARAVEVGELEYTYKGDIDSITTGDQYR